MQSTAHSTSNVSTSYPQQSLTHSGNEPQEEFSELVADVSAAVGRYCSRRPQVVAGFLFSLGFVVGWKLRPW